MVLADTPLLLGDNLLPSMVLALGGAMAVGNALALLRPPEQRAKDTDLVKAPVARSVVFIVVGLVAAVWALATLLA